MTSSLHVSLDPTADVTFFTVKERGDGKAKSLVAFEGRWNPGCPRFARSEAARPSPAPQAESGKGAGSQVSKIISSDDLHFRNQTRCRLSACRVELGCQALVFCHLDLKQPVRSCRKSLPGRSPVTETRSRGSSRTPLPGPRGPRGFRRRVVSRPVQASTFLLAGLVRTEAQGKETQTFPQIEPRKDLTRPFETLPSPKRLMNNSVLSDLRGYPRSPWPSGDEGVKSLRVGGATYCPRRVCWEGHSTGGCDGRGAGGGPGLGGALPCLGPSSAGAADVGPRHPGRPANRRRGTLCTAGCEREAEEKNDLLLHLRV